MPTETVGYVEMEWTCGKCGTRNKGTDRTCVSCGAPMPTDQKFERPVESTLLTDQAKIDAARKGADIHCPYCGARNPGDAKICHQCQGDLTKGQRRESGTVIGAHVEAKVEPTPCPSCGTPNAPSAARCVNCGRPLGATAEAPATLATAAATPAGAAQPASVGRSALPWIGLAIGAVFLMLCVMVGLWYYNTTTSTTDVNATVANVHWERIIAIEERVRVTHSNWRDRIPNEGEVKQCELKPREVLSAPDPDRRSDKICGTPYEVDLGNGVSEVRQDCNYQVFDDWCDYTQLEWQVADRITASGADLDPEWPALNLASGQREGAHSESFVITFAADGRQFDYSVADSTAFAEFEPGSDWVLAIDGFGNIDDLKPTR